MPFKSKGRKFYKIRVTGSDGRSVVAGCGTDDLLTARAMHSMVKEFRRKRFWKPLDLIVSQRAKLPDVFDKHDSGELKAWLKSFDAPDLIPLVDEWNGNAKYKTQVRAMLGEKARADTFTRKTISKFLAGLDVTPSTKNRYRAALSVFGKWLVEREILDHNPVKDVQGFKQNEREPVWLERSEAKALIGALSNPYRAIEALMAATGVEWQVVERLQGRDIDFAARSLHAKGSKTRWRNRIVRGTELWAWEIFAEYARRFTDNAVIFAGVDKYTALRKHRAASNLLNLRHTTLHDWRHTYAVLSLRAGYKPQVVAHQLGHHDANLVITRYGRWIPDERDYLIHAAPLAQASGRGE